jgi:hypothetical protein
LLFGFKSSVNILIQKQFGPSGKWNLSLLVTQMLPTRRYRTLFVNTCYQFANIYYFTYFIFTYLTLILKSPYSLFIFLWFTFFFFFNWWIVFLGKWLPIFHNINPLLQFCRTLDIKIRYVFSLSHTAIPYILNAEKYCLYKYN